MTIQNPDRYTWGQSARVRAYRDYFGIGTYDMADIIGMSRRSYLRMESGEAAIPPGLFDTLNDLVTTFEQEVRQYFDLARDDDGRATISVEPSDSQWKRTVVAHAAMRDPRLRPRSSDDITAEKANAHERPS